MSETNEPPTEAKKLSRDDLGKPQPIASGKRSSFVLPGDFLEFVVKDEAGNPYSFLKYELVFDLAPGLPPRAPIVGHLDENGRIRLDPVPPGEYKIAIFDGSGARVRLIDLAHVAAAAPVAPAAPTAPQAEPAR